MNGRNLQTLRTYEQLQLGDRIELTHEVRVGMRSWESITKGTVVEVQRRRHGYHHQRNFDDKVFSDSIVVRRDDGELTTITLDEFSTLVKV